MKREREDHSQIYEFGPFRLDTGQRVLWRDGKLLALAPKVFDTLLVLVQRNGQIVEKSELMDAVWPDAFVEENNLNHNISAIRKVLDDGEEGITYIQTVQRRGYRFKAEVSNPEPETPEPKEPEISSQTAVPEREISMTEADSFQEPSTPIPVSASGRSGMAVSTAVPSRGNGRVTNLLSTSTRARRISLVGGISLAAGILTVAVIVMVRPIRKKEAPNNPAVIPTVTQGKYLAVLPFKVSGDPSLNYIAEGLRDALSDRLRQAHSFHVASASSAERAGTNGTLDGIAHRLGANLLVEGTLRGNSSNLSLAVTVHDVPDARLIWNAQFNGSTREILTLEDTVYSKLLAALNPSSSRQAPGPHAHVPTEDVEAYDLYLRGKDAMRQRQNPQNVLSAIHYYQGALKKDPGFANAYAATAEASLEMYRQSRGRFWAEKAVNAAKEAARLNDNLAEAHFALGSVYQATGQPEMAVAEDRRGLELDPNSDNGFRQLGNAHLSLGRNNEALDAYKKATEIDPYYWFNFNVLGNAYFQTGNYRAALSAFHQVTKLDPDNAYGYDNIGAVYIVQGRWAEAVPVYQKALRLQPGFVAYSNLGTACFYLKQYHRAAAMFEKAVAMSPSDQVVLGNLADAYRWSGQLEKAAAAYDRAIASAYRDLQVDPRNATALESLALYYAKKGDGQQAVEFIRRARAIDSSNVQFIYNEATVMALAGHPNEAVAALKEAFDRGYPRAEANQDPELATLRRLPEFEKLMHQGLGSGNDGAPAGMLHASAGPAKRREYQ